MNVLKHFKKVTLLTLLGNGISQHEIARKTHIDRKTIRKYQVELESSEKISNSPMDGHRLFKAFGLPWRIGRIGSTLDT